MNTIDQMENLPTMAKNPTQGQTSVKSVTMSLEKLIKNDPEQLLSCLYMQGLVDVKGFMNKIPSDSLKDIIDGLVDIMKHKLEPTEAPGTQNEAEVFHSLINKFLKGGIILSLSYPKTLCLWLKDQCKRFPNTQLKEEFIKNFLAILKNIPGNQKEYSKLLVVEQRARKDDLLNYFQHLVCILETQPKEQSINSERNEKSTGAKPKVKNDSELRKPMPSLKPSTKAESKIISRSFTLQPESKLPHYNKEKEGRSTSLEMVMTPKKEKTQLLDYGLGNLNKSGIIDSFEKADARINNIVLQLRDDIGAIDVPESSNQRQTGGGNGSTTPEKDHENQKTDSSTNTEGGTSTSDSEDMLSDFKKGSETTLRPGRKQYKHSAKPHKKFFNFGSAPPGTISEIVSKKAIYQYIRSQWTAAEWETFNDHRENNNIRQMWQIVEDAAYLCVSKRATQPMRLKTRAQENANHEELFKMIAESPFFQTPSADLTNCATQLTQLLGTLNSMIATVSQGRSDGAGRDMTARDAVIIPPLMPIEPIQQQSNVIRVNRSQPRLNQVGTLENNEVIKRLM